MNEHEYAEILIELIRRLPSDLPLMRFATDTPQHEIVAPKWHMSKGQFSKYVTEQMRLRGYRQGDLFEAGRKTPEPPIPAVFEGRDGSCTFWNETFHDYYHPKSGARKQADTLFLQESSLKERLEKGSVRLLDIGFGMGYNSLLACEMAQKLAQHSLEINAIDQDRIVLRQSADSIQNIPDEKLAWPQILKELHNKGQYASKYFDIIFDNSDVWYALARQKGAFDVIFLDPFVTRSNCSMVTLEIFKHLKKRLKKDGVLICSKLHTAAISAMIEAGFRVEAADKSRSDIRGIVARHEGPSSEGNRTIPYRDPYGVWTDRKIRQYREEEMKNTKHPS